MSKLSKNEKTLLLAGGLYFCAITIANVFSNVFLFSYHNSYTVMAGYTACKCICMFLSFYLLSTFLSKHSIMYSMNVGLCFLILTFACILFMGEKLSSIAVLFGISSLWGFGEGGFYLAFNTLTQGVTNPTSRIRFVGVNGAMNACLAVFSPLIASACVLIAKSDIKGYILSFQVVIVLFLCVLIILRLLRFEHEKESVNFKGSMQYFKEESWRFLCTINFLQGFRESLSICITGLLIFQLMKDNSSLYASVLAVFSVMSVISNTCISKCLKERNQALLLGIGSLGILFSGLILVIDPSFLNAVIHGITHNIFVPFISLPVTFYTMNILQKSIKKKEFGKRIVIREFFLEMGRVLGFVTFVIISYYFDINTAFYVIYSSCILLWMYMVRKKAIIKRYL